MMIKQENKEQQTEEFQKYSKPTDAYLGVTREQLEIFNYLVHPTWVFDIETRKMKWANDAAISLWNADTLESLLQRDFASDMSESSNLRLKEYQVKLANNERIKDQWTFYPKGQAKTVAATFSGIRLSQGWIGHDKLSMLVEAIPLVKGDVDKENLRGVEMLRHLPMAVCQFDIKGKVMFQNPEALEMFGTYTAQRNRNSGSNKSDRNNDKKNKNEKNASDSTTNEQTKTTTTSQHENKKRSRDSQNTISSEDSGQASTVTTVEQKELHKQGGEETTTGNNTSTTNNEKTEEEVHFLARFVDKKLGQQVLEQVQNGKDCSVEAIQVTQKGPMWSAIKVRRALDPVTGKPVILYSARDITETVLAKKETEANIRRSEFFAIMAHEIRTPLHQVTGFIELLDQTKLTVEQKSFVHLLKASANSLLTVINDVLDYSKLEAGKMKLEAVPFEPKAVVQGSLEAVRQQIEEKGIILDNEWHHDGIPFRMLGDPNRLRQVLLNLLQNSVKFTSRGHINLRAEAIQDVSAKRSLLKVSVSDTGIGISEEQMQRIFVKYQQADASVARNYGGTGLGLSICKQLVENMGGQIGVNSKLGAGATFWFTIPIEIPKEGPDHNTNNHEEEDETATPVEKKRKTDTIDSKKSTSRPASLNVLVAEDNKVNQKLAANMLKRLGHKATIVNNGKEAVEAVNNNHESFYDVILMDIQMPIMDGIEATKRLRSQGCTSLPIIALTACVLRDDFVDIGFDDWIGKPILMKALNVKLNQMCEAKKKKLDAPTLSTPRAVDG